MSNPTLSDRLLRVFGRVLPRSCCTDQPAEPTSTGERCLSEPGSLLPIYERDHILGSNSARVTLVEYGDYQCKDCGELDAGIAAFLAEAGDQIRFVFRQYPFSKIHPHAQLAAEAAEAAAAQGKFWEMHRILFLHQNELREKDIVRHAETLGLDVERLECELRNRTYQDRVVADFRSGVSNGVFATPTLFINGIRHGSNLDRRLLLDLARN